MQTLLFNKSGEGIEELREFLPNLYASIDFNEIKTYLDESTDKLIEDIGKETYQVAAAHYESNDFGSTSSDELKLKNELVRLFRVPVSQFAYLEFAPIRDLKDDGNGRRLHVDENSKIPSDRLIDRQEEKIFQRAYRGMDRLIDFLNDNKVTFQDWLNSELYKQRSSLLIPDPKSFDDIFPIENSSWLFLKCLPFNKQSQDHAIKYIGETRFQSLLTHLPTKAWEGVEEELYNHLSIAIAYSTMAKAYKRLPIRMLPDGMVKMYHSDRNNSKGSLPVDPRERFEVASNLQKEADEALISVQEIIRSENLKAKGETYPKQQQKTQSDYNKQKFFRP